MSCQKYIGYQCHENMALNFNLYTDLIFTSKFIHAEVFSVNVRSVKIGANKVVDIITYGNQTLGWWILSHNLDKNHNS